MNALHSAHQVSHHVDHDAHSNTQPHTRDNAPPEITLSPDQRSAMESVIKFVTERQAPCMTLTGSAGTGKTTLIRQMIQALHAMKIPVYTVAPTGRAARVLSKKTGVDARTIHGAIYSLSHVEVRERFTDAQDPGVRYHFPLKRDDLSRSVWIVDESSMVGDAINHSDEMQFGSGRLLTDLLHYLRLGARGGASKSPAQVIFVGDPIQLSPVHGKHSPLDQGYLERAHQLNVVRAHLSQIHRQAQDSGILENAIKIRDAVEQKMLYRVKVKPHEADVRFVDHQSAIQTLIQAHQRGASCVGITYSNASAYRVVRTVREALFGHELHPLQVGEPLLVMKNHYRYGLTNGDLLRVEGPIISERAITLKINQKPVSLRFIKLPVSLKDSPEQGVRAIWVLDTMLWSDQRDDPPTVTQALLVDALQRSQAPRGSRQFSEFLLSDPFFNATRLRFGYALTCHKAQGGEWDHVCLMDQRPEANKSLDAARWVYTAITRAQRWLSLVTPEAPHAQVPLYSASGARPQSLKRADHRPAQPSAQSSSHQRQDQESSMIHASPSLSAPPQSTSIQAAPAQTIEGQVAAQVLRAVERLGLDVAEHRHHQYQLKVLIRDRGEVVPVSVFYNKKGLITRVTGEREFSGLTAEALNESALRELVRDVDEGDQHLERLVSALYIPEYQELTRRVFQDLSAQEIKVARVKTMPYRVRFELMGPRGSGLIDFTHKASYEWTSCVPVNQSPTSQLAASLCQ